MKLLKYENSKLKEQFIFNLPVSKAICGRVCPGCYALKPQIRFPKTVLPARERNYQASLHPDFITTVVSELNKTKRSFSSVRIHESGEFYSQAYIDKWQTIATTLPNVNFYAFTKRIKDFDFTQLMSLPNVVIIDSLMNGGLNYGPISQLSSTVKTCPATDGTTDICDSACGYCWSKPAQSNGVQFVKH